MRESDLVGEIAYDNVRVQRLCAVARAVTSVV